MIIWLGCAILFACKWPCMLVFFFPQSVCCLSRKKRKTAACDFLCLQCPCQVFYLGIIATTWIEILFVSIFSKSLLKVSSVSKYLEQLIREWVLNYGFNMVTRLRIYQILHVFLCQFWKKKCFCRNLSISVNTHSLCIIVKLLIIHLLF